MAAQVLGMHVDVGPAPIGLRRLRAKSAQRRGSFDRFRLASGKHLAESDQLRPISADFYQPSTGAWDRLRSNRTASDRYRPDRVWLGTAAVKALPAYVRAMVVARAIGVPRRSRARALRRAQWGKTHTCRHSIRNWLVWIVLATCGRFRSDPDFLESLESLECREVSRFPRFFSDFLEVLDYLEFLDFLESPEVL